MSALRLVALHTDEWRALLEGAPSQAPSLNDEQRRVLATRFRDVGDGAPRRLDAWSVERPSRTAFRWSRATARRSLGNAALRRVVAGSPSVRDAAQDVIDDRLLNAAAGLARTGSLGHWLAQLSNPSRALVCAEATNWATTLLELTRGLDVPLRLAPSDAYYAVAGARTTLRAAREFIVDGSTRVIVRVRAGAPGRSAGAGLRAELAIEALAHPSGDAPGRLVGAWPDAGVALSLESSLVDVRAGARHLLHAARDVGPAETLAA